MDGAWRWRVACAVMGALALSGCGLLLDLDSPDPKPLDAGIAGFDAGPPRRDGGRRRDAAASMDATAEDALAPEDAGPPDVVRRDATVPDAGCGCDPSTSDRCSPASGRCLCGGGDPCDGDRSCCRGADETGCVDLRSDPLHCGACGRACGPNSRCRDGMCECEGGFVDCDGEPGCEVNPDLDPMHCGSCPMSCPSTQPSCVRGACVACSSSSDCPNDPHDCTDAPRCTAGTCSYPLLPGSCLIDGECWTAGTKSPSNPCLVCEPSADPTAWTVRTGQSCDDGLFCTDGDACSPDATCTGRMRVCGMSLFTCVAAFVCDEARDACMPRVVPTQCFDPVGMACYLAGTQNPANRCEACDPVVNPTGWTRRPDGAACDDGRVCTTGERCDVMGGCGGGTPTSCDDSNDCTMDTCREPMGCAHTADNSRCLISGVCMMAGTHNPMNWCLICDPTGSGGRTSWTPTPGASCTLENPCFTTAACSSAAASTCEATGWLCGPPGTHGICTPPTGGGGPHCSCDPGFTDCDGNSTNGCQCRTADGGASCTMMGTCVVTGT